MRVVFWAKVDHWAGYWWVGGGDGFSVATRDQLTLLEAGCRRGAAIRAALSQPTRDDEAAGDEPNDERSDVG